MPASGTWIACDARGVRLDFRKPLAADHSHRTPLAWPRSKMRCSAAVRLSVDGDDHLAADFVGDPSSCAELLHRLLAGPAVERLERAGLVVDAGVQDAGVVAGLVGGDRGSFSSTVTGGRGNVPETVGRGQAHDAAADDREVVGGHKSENHQGIKTPRNTNELVRR